MICAAIFKNGEFVGISADGSFDIVIDPEQDKLTIRTANRMGGLGPEGHVAGTTGVDAIRANKQGADVIYTLQGVRVEKATKGLYIINGKVILMK